MCHLVIIKLEGVNTPHCITATRLMFLSVWGHFRYLNIQPILHRHYQILKNIKRIQMLWISANQHPLQAEQKYTGFLHGSGKTKLRWTHIFHFPSRSSQQSTEQNRTTRRWRSALDLCCSRADQQEWGEVTRCLSNLWALLSMVNCYRLEQNLKWLLVFVLQRVRLWSRRSSWLWAARPGPQTANVPVQYYHLSERSTPVGTSADTEDEQTVRADKRSRGEKMDTERRHLSTRAQRSYVFNSTLVECQLHPSAASCRDVHISRLRRQNTTRETGPVRFEYLPVHHFLKMNSGAPDVDALSWFCPHTCLSNLLSDITFLSPVPSLLLFASSLCKHFHI